ncbi:hypothetical protein GCM10009777_02630 [Microbacterium pumilum]|uniref:Uncharacterized protein n=1 Tax=Microbacterium pumilum TaxID=344165 RepID=A0ABP5D4R3_9MICO
MRILELGDRPLEGGDGGGIHCARRLDAQAVWNSCTAAVNSGVQTLRGLDRCDGRRPMHPVDAAV